MDLTKKELIRVLPRYIVLGHGNYTTSPKVFTVPTDTVFIFLSKASRYLSTSIITPQFYDFFGKNPTGSVPPVMEGWTKRVYGPGERISDIHLAFIDPEWPGMGIHKLPVRMNQFKTTPGMFHGKTGFLSSMANLPGVFFIVACRPLPGQPMTYMRQNVNYYFSSPTLGRRLLNENKVSQSILKRRRRESPSNPIKRRRIV